MSKALNTLIRGSAISFIAMIFLGVINYLIRRTLALNLTAVEYGFFYAVFSFCSLFLAYLDLGLGQSTVILMTKYNTQKLYDKANAIFSFVVSFKLIGGAIIITPLYLLTPYLAKHYFDFAQGEDLLYIFWAMIPVAAISGACYSALDSRKDFFTKNVLNIFQFLAILITLYCLIENMGLDIAIVAFVYSPAVVFILGNILLTKLYSIKFSFKDAFKREMFSEIFHLSKWVALSVAGMTTMSQMDTQMLVWFKGLESVALYNIALPIQQILCSFMFLPQVFTPIATDLWHSGNTKELKRICSLFISLSTVLGGAVVIALICVRDLLIIYLFDEKYLATEYALVILCSGMGVFVVAQFFMNTLNAIGKQKMVTRNIVAGVVVNIVVNALLIPIWGISGAAVATCCSYVVISILSLNRYE